MLRRKFSHGAMPIAERLEPRVLLSSGVLIVTSSELAGAFQAVGDWYTRKGHPAEIVTTDEIYSSYSGVDQQEQIRNCIRDYYENESIGYVLLGGDNSIVPDRNTRVVVGSYTSADMPTDLYYASLDGTWDSDGDGIYGEAQQDTDVDLEYDVIVARYPIRTAEHVQIILNKVLAYETAPPSTDWATEMLATGEQLWTTYDPGTYGGFAFDHEVSDAEIKSHVADADYVQPYWSDYTVDMLFDTYSTWDSSVAGDYDLTVANLNAAMAGGYQFMQMGTHGGYTVWSLESGSYTSSSVEALTTFADVAVVSTMACNTGAFDRADSALSEAFLRSPMTSTVAYLGCSRYGWGYYGASLGPSIRYSYQFYKSFLANDYRTLGEAFAASKEYFASASEYEGSYRWVQFGLNLQGDPLVRMYRTDPTPQTPTYDASVFAGTQTYTVSGLSAGASVCLWQGDTVYEVGEANASGVYTTTIDPETGAMKLTIVADDSPVYTADVSVTAAEPQIGVSCDGQPAAEGDTLDIGVVEQGESGNTLTLTVTNTGTGTLTLEELGDTSHLTIGSWSDTTLTAGQSATLTITMKTAVVGAFTDELTILSNDAEDTTFTFSVTGEVEALTPYLDVAEGGQAVSEGDTLDIGVVEQGESGNTLTLTVTNTGTGTLTLEQLANTSHLTIGSWSDTALTAGQSATLTITMKTAVVGAFTDELTILSNDAEDTTFTFSVVGAVVVVPDIGVTRGGQTVANGQSTLDIGTAEKGTAGSTLTLTVTNTGTGTLVLQPVAGTSHLVVGSWGDSTLAAGESTTLTITLRTDTAGAFTDELTILSNDAENPTFSFFVAGEVVVLPDLSVTCGGQDVADGQTTLNIGAANEGEAGNTLTLTVTNTGTGTLVLQPVAGTSHLVVGSWGDSTLAAGQSTTLTVTMDTAASGAFSDQLTIFSNDADDAVFTLDVAGVVLAATPQIQVMRGGQQVTDGQTTLDIGTVEHGTAGNTLTLTVTNTGNGTLTLQPVAGTSHLVVGSWGDSTLEAGESTTLTITMNSAVTGAFNDQLTILSNDADDVAFTFNVSGAVVVLPDLSASCGGQAVTDGQTTLDIGTAEQYDDGTTLTLAVTNTGTGTLTLEAVAGTSHLSVGSWGDSTLEAGESTTLTITLKTNAAGAFTEQLTVLSNDADDGVFTFSVTGTVTERQLPPGLEGYWQFEQNADDAARNNDGVTQNGAGYSSDGAVGDGSASFDGRDDYVSIGDPDSLQIVGEITMAAWIKIDSARGVGGIITKGLSRSPRGMVFLRVVNNRLQVGSWSGRIYAATTRLSRDDFGAWMHVAGTYDGSSWNLYLNGELVASRNASQGAIAVESDWAIGALGTGTGQFFRGNIDDARIYSRGIGSEEVGELVEMGPDDGQGDDPDDGQDGEPQVGHWTFDGTAADAMGECDAVAMNGASFSTDSAVGSHSIHFDGVDDYVSIGDPQSLRITGEITLAAWVNMESSAGVQSIITKGYSVAPRGMVFLRIVNGFYQVGSWDGRVYAASAAVSVADVGNWVHVAGTYDGSAWNLYLNGELVSSARADTGAVPVASDWAIGSLGTGNRYFFQGNIDDVQIHSEGLSAEEIGELVDAGAATLDLAAAAQPTLVEAPMDAVSEGENLGWRKAEAADEVMTRAEVLASRFMERRMLRCIGSDAPAYARPRAFTSLTGERVQLHDEQGVLSDWSDLLTRVRDRLTTLPAGIE